MYSTEWHNHLFFVVDMLILSPDAQWSQHEVTAAGGNGYADDINQLNWLCELDVDDDNQSIIIADCWNHCIDAWKMGEKNGKVTDCGQGHGNRLDQLYYLIDVLIGKETNSVLIANLENQQVLRWSRHQGTTQGDVIVEGVRYVGLVIDHQRYFYVSNFRKDEVRRYAIGDRNGIVVAGGNRQGNQLNQVNGSTYLFVDEGPAVYVSDTNNHRVMKWSKSTKENILVTGGPGKGSALTQLSCPEGLFADTSGTIYVADSWNHDVTRLSIAV